jgi:Rrf2 family protein
LEQRGMKMSEGVEWTAHACVLLATLPPGSGLPASSLAEFHALAPAYMAKHMQALARAGVVESLRGPAGGYRLGRPAKEITLWDIVIAIEGDERTFQCTEIRQQGPCGGSPHEFRKPCGIHAVFNKAEAAWRAELKSVSIADLANATAAKTSPQRRAALTEWLDKKLS